jgi:hypothetical protein
VANQGTTGFKRMIVGLPHNPQDFSAVSTTAWLAKQLGINLVGALLEDIGLSQLADLPGIREFRTLSGWQPFTADLLIGDLARASAEAQRLFAQLIEQHNAGGSFHLAKASAADLLRQATGSDIVAIIDPRNPLDRITRQFGELIDIVVRTEAAVLIVPGSPPLASGRLIAAGSRANDPAIVAAIALASSTREPLTIIPLDQSAQALTCLVERAKRSGVHATIAVPMHHRADLSSLATVSHNLKGKLLIASSARLAAAEQTLSQLRPPVPLLLVRPEAAG